MTDVDTDLVEVSRTGTVLTVEMVRPDKLNALNPELVGGLRDAFAEVSGESGLGVLLTGRGRVTCAGMDRDIVSGDYYAEHDDLDAMLGDLYGHIERHPGPVAMAGKGAVIGAATILSMSCEFLVLGEGTTFSIPEVSFGIASERAVERLAPTVGRHVAAELLLTGGEIDAARAREVGLANDVVPPETVEDRGRDLLSSVTEHDPDTVADLVGLLADRVTDQ